MEWDSRYASCECADDYSPCLDVEDGLLDLIESDFSGFDAKWMLVRPKRWKMIESSPNLIGRHSLGRQKLLFVI